MASRHVDKLVRSFLSNVSSPEFNKFDDIQDPTFLSFKVDFFPDDGIGFPDDAYSSGGLLRKRLESSAYQFYDSAAEYLARIGAPNRQRYLEAFIQLLNDLQEKAPWYFQSISGMNDLYTIDPANNYRGDKVLTFDCLESVDLRMSQLGDFYRNIAFDFQGMREVLPINLRTFNMNIHVLEFRRFNTTFGIIADHFSNRSEKGQVNQQRVEDAKRRNVFNQDNSRLFTGTFDNIGSVANRLNNTLGGIFSNLGEQSGNFGDPSIESAFEAISVQTFVLKDCEFDFFSEAPGYLDTVSVKDIPEATYKFKVKVGKIQKTSTYSFDNYVISEYTKHSKIQNIASTLGRTIVPSEAYFEQLNPSVVEDPNTFYRNYRERIFPSEGDPKRAQAEAYNRAAEESEFLRRKPLERILGSLIRNSTGIVNQELNQVLGEATGGVIGTTPLGNVYGDRSFFTNAVEALNSFLTPGNQLTSNQTSAQPPEETLGNINLGGVSDGKLGIGVPIPPGTNVGLGQPFNPGEIGDSNVFSGSRIPSSDVIKTNIFSDTKVPPTGDIGKSNVFE